MRNEVIQKNEANQATGSDELLKATTLLYLKDSLEKEEYEVCQELISIAKKFGVEQGEISQVIAEYIDEVKSRKVI